MTLTLAIQPQKDASKALSIRPTEGLPVSVKFYSSRVSKKQLLYNGKPAAGGRSRDYRVCLNGMDFLSKT